MKNLSAGLLRALNLRQEIAAIAIAATFLAIGVNLISSVIQSKLSAAAVGIVAGCMILGTLFFWALRLKSTSKFKTIISSNLCLEKDLSVARIGRYRFSIDAQMYLKSLFIENNSLKSQWDKQLGSQSIKLDKETLTGKYVNPKLLFELAEYMVLERLSTHLTDYFNSRNFKKSPELELFERDHLANILIANRVMDQMTRSPLDRSAFKKESDTNEKAVFIYSSSGAVYSKFDLNLPKGTKINRTIDGGIQLSHSHFEMVLRISNCVTSHSFPDEFENLYLGKDSREVSTRMVVIEISGTSTWRGLSNFNRWDHVMWIDSFLDTIKNDYDFDSFLKSIGYELALTQFILDSNSSRKNVRPRKLKQVN